MLSTVSPKADSQQACDLKVSEIQGQSLQTSGSVMKEGRLDSVTFSPSLSVHSLPCSSILLPLASHPGATNPTRYLSTQSSSPVKGPISNCPLHPNG